MGRTVHCDLAIAGGGLAGGLIALALAAKRPELSVVIVDSGEAIGGNHIWSFFEGDIAEEDRWLVDPLVGHRWDAYHVVFPAHRRRLIAGYRSIRSSALDAAVRAALAPEQIVTGVKAIGLSKTAIVLDDGARVQARAVIDARGPGDLGLIDCGWQKFVGQVVRTAQPHGLKSPVVMDASVEQIDGYRFVYLLPMGADRLLIEDTYYSDTPDLDHDAVTARIAAYATARRWQIAGIDHEESGVLPVILGGDFEGYWQSGGKDVAKAGLRAGLCHPTTGYSLPDAVRTASFVAGLEQPASRTLHEALYGFAKAAWEERGFYRMVDRMLFRAAEPEQRYKVLERFYTLDAGLIGRFYAARSTGFDRLRVLAGKPPVPIHRAIAAIAS